ncbi:MAG: histidine phosphatase family protein [Ginsengibacter sp.]
MKTLLIVRHAKSAAADFGQSDFDRPLNKRGKEDSIEMAQRVAEVVDQIDAFISSPAKRARKTAEKFLDQYGVEKEEMILIPSLYEAEEADFYEAIENLDDTYQTVALFSHNPGITDFANSQNCLNIFNMPTGSVYAIQFETDKWSGIRIADRKALFFFKTKDEM